MIAIVDYRAGNITSVAQALKYLGEPCEVTADPAVLRKASHIIFPGVGAAGEAMANLGRTKLGETIKEEVGAGKPLLGICLGTQIIFAYSEENDTACLGIVPGRVRRFPPDLQEGDRLLKIPHMGWNQVDFCREHPVDRKSTRLNSSHQKISY